jgi:hypothetical protein
MAKRERSFPLSEPLPGESWRKVLRNSNEGIAFKPYTRKTFNAGDIRSAVQALVGRYLPSLAEHQ